jgi:phospholipase C
MAEAIGNLEKIKHIVVLMMENRSFDHMLGFLKLEGMAEVNGLTGNEYNLDPDGDKIGITAFDADAQKVQRHGEALEKKLDPDHSVDGVRTQLGHGYGDFPNGGFVKAFIESRDPKDKVGKDLWMVPMGYYTSKDLPVYDYLAHQYCVCDAWHSSIPGDTWPNRQYALAGQAGEKVNLRLGLLRRLLLKLTGLKLPGDPPLYEVPAFTRHLEEAQWRWYSHDPATLRCADGLYRKPGDLKKENFRYFERKTLSPVTKTAESWIFGHDSFLDDVAKGQLRAVSWIDPNFIDLNILDPNSNDDHPPTDIRAGQQLVLDTYEALANSPAWEQTLLVVVYDEHGGVYDHVTPPAVPAGDNSGFDTLGVRVPALVIGPHVRQHVSHELFDHTSLIKTILLRFAGQPEQAIQQMGPRVANAAHLGGLVADEPRRELGDLGPVRQQMRQWREGARAARTAPRANVKSPAPDGAGHPLVLTEFQDEFMKAAYALRHGVGVPPGHP